MLNLERLRILHLIATHGSVTAAAEILHVTTSAISQQMAKLEREAGQPLLERNGRGVRLTDAAELLAVHATAMLSRAEEAQADLEAHRGAVAGRLTISSIATAARGLAPAALRELSHRHPQLRISLSEAEPHESLPHVKCGDTDVAIVQDWFNAPLPAHLPLPPRDGLVKAPLVEDIVDVALSEDHVLAGRDAIALEDLAGEPWITWSRGLVCNDWLVNTMRARNIEPDIAHTATEHTTQLALVAAGLGAAVIPRLGRDPVPDGVRFVAIQPALGRHVYAVWREGADRRPAIRATIRALRAAASHSSAPALAAAPSHAPALAVARQRGN